MIKEITSDLLHVYIAGNFEAENSLILTVTMIIGQHSQYSALSSDITDLAMLLTQRFWWESVSL